MALHFRAQSTRAATKVRRMCYLLEFCWQHDIFYLIEQPQTSLMFDYAPLAHVLRRHRAKMTTCDMGAFGARSVKPTKSDPCFVTIIEPGAVFKRTCALNEACG